MSNSRYVFLDYARLMAAFLVIYGHLYTYDSENFIRVFIYEFHMPFFFLVSGMLHKYTGKIRVRKYFSTLIIPAIFFLGSFLIFTSILYQKGFCRFKDSIPQELIDSSFAITMKEYLLFSIKGFSNGTYIANGPCWFLIALFYCKVMTDIFNKKFLLSAMVWCILFYVLCIHRNRGFFIANAVMAFPFYYCGYVLKKYIVNIMQIKHKALLALFAFMVTLLIMKVNGNVSMWGVLFGRVRYLCLPLFYISGLSGSLMLLFICLLLPQNEGGVNKYADALISILGLQYFFIFVIDNTVGYNLGYLKSLILAILVFVGCIMGHFLLLKICPRAIGKQSQRTL